MKQHLHTQRLSLFLFVIFAMLFQENGYALTCEAASGNKCWYVDPNAQGLNNGTSWSDAWSSVYGISALVQPGDYVYLSGGPDFKYYNLTTTWHVPAGSDAAHPITYKVGQDVGHSGMVIFDGRMHWVNGIGGNDALIGMTKYATISGDFQGQRRIRIQNFFSPAIYADNSVGLRLEYLDCFATMRFGGSTQLEVANSRFKFPRNNAGDGDIQELLYLGTVGSSFGASSIHDNIIDVYQDFDLEPNVSGGGGADVFKWPAATDIYNNVIRQYFQPFSSGIDHQDIIQGGGDYLRVFNNYFENGTSAILYITPATVLSHAWFYNNILTVSDIRLKAGIHKIADIASQDNTTAGFRDVKIVNNTVVDSSAFAGLSVSARVPFSPDQVLIANNLLFNTGTSGFGAIRLINFSEAPDLKNNLVDGGTSGVSWSSFPSANGKSWNGSAKFRAYAPYAAGNDYRLSATDTVARGGGVDLSPYCNANQAGAWLCKDIEGTTRPTGAAWDIGAYQYRVSYEDVSPPTAPTDLFATFQHWSQATIEWSDAYDENGIAGYRIYRDGVLIDTIGNPSYTDPSLNPSTSYEYGIQAYDKAGNASAIAKISIQTPAGFSMLKIGDLVEVISDRTVSTEVALMVKSVPAPRAGLDGQLTSSLGYKSFGERGTIIEGPRYEYGYTWWKIDWVAGADGWTPEGLGPALNLKRVNAASAYALRISKSGGGGGIVKGIDSKVTMNCGAICSSNQPFNSVATIVAVPDADSLFMGWSGEGCSGSRGYCSVKMLGDLTLTAVFVKKGTSDIKLPSRPNRLRLLS